MHDKEQDQSLKADMQRSFNLLQFFAQILAFPGEVLMRWTAPWGTHYLGFHAVLGWLSILLAASFTPKPQWLFGYFVLIGALLLAHRIRGMRYRARGYMCHSKYSGGSIFPGNEYRAKGTWEPGTLLALGGGLLFLDLGLGGFVMVSAIAQSFVYAMSEERDLARVRKQRDAQFEAAYLTEQMRGE